MCFSAGASFGAGIVLSTIGIATLKKAHSPGQLPFALVPLIFSVQQFTEGFVWLSESNADFSAFQQPCTYIFLFIAQVLWPVWVPFSVMKLEPREQRKKMHTMLAAAGALVSLYLAYCLVNYPVESGAAGYHISYKQDYPASLSRYSSVLYIAATVLPPFFSSIKRMRWLGTAILISYIITAIFYEDYVVSVWCFFASVISITILAVFYEQNKTTGQAVASSI